MDDSLYSTGIRPALDDYFVKESEKVRDYGDYWSASSAGYCYRYNIFKRLGVTEVDEVKADKARQQRVFHVGHTFHADIQSITKEAGVSIAQEEELQDEDLMVRGHFDDIVLINQATDKSGKPLTYAEWIGATKEYGGTREEYDKMQNLILYDYKTVNSMAFNYPSELKPTHRMQLGTYLFMLRKLKPTYNGVAVGDIQEARIMELSKDDYREREQQLLWDKQLALDVHGYWSRMNEYWARYEATGELPECKCEEMLGAWMAKRSKAGKVYNPWFLNGEPCSQEVFNNWKKEQ